MYEKLKNGFFVIMNSERKTLYRKYKCSIKKYNEKTKIMHFYFNQEEMDKHEIRKIKIKNFLCDYGL